MKKPIVILALLCLMLTTAACTATDKTDQPQISTEQTTDDGIESVDLEAVETDYINPIEAFQGTFSYTWNSISEIKADDFILLCSANNYLGLPRDWESVYLEPFQPAQAVEAAIQEHFDVTTEYLRTSKYYNAEGGTYELVVGANSADALAISAKQTGSRIDIEIGILAGLMDREPHPYETQTPQGFLTRQGTLTVEEKEDGTFEYISFVLSENHA